MKIVEKVTISELKELSKPMMNDIVKADVDIVKKIVIIDAEYHSDMESYLIEKGSNGDDLWGINFHPHEYGTENFVEFDSMINLKPRLGNNTRYVEDEKIRKEIIDIVNGVIEDA